MDASFVVKLPGCLRDWWSQRLFTGPAAGVAEHAREDGSKLGFLESWQAFALLAILAAGMLLTNLSYPLIEPDETRYSHIAAEMVRTGDYLVPRRLGKPHLDKPPLLYWLAAGSIRLFGQHEMAVRLPSALAGLATVLALYLLGKRIFPARAAWIGAVLLLFSMGYAVAARFVITDCLLTLFTTLAALFGLLAVRDTQRNATLDLRWWLLAAMAVGAGTLVKGPVSLVLFGPPLVAYVWLTPAAARVRVWHWALLLGITAIIAGPWFVLISRAEPNFFEYFFLKHNVQRFTNTFHHAEPFWFYVPVLIGCMLPASLLFPALGAFLLSRREELRSQRSWELGYLLLAAAWVFGFFSLASGKLPTYILPLLPLLCLALGFTFHAGILRETEQRLLKWFATFGPRQIALTFAFFLAIAGGVQVFFALRAGDAIALDAALVGVAIVSYIVLLFVPFQHLRNWSVVLGMGWLLCTYGLNRVYPTIAGVRSYMLAAAELAEDKSIVGDQTSVAFYISSHEGAEFYIDSARLRQFRSGDEQRLLALIREQRDLIIVSSPGAFAELDRALPDDIELLTSGPRRFVHRACVESGPAIMTATKATDERR